MFHSHKRIFYYFLSQFPGSALEFIRWHNHCHQPDTLGFSGINHVAGEDKLAGFVNRIFALPAKLGEMGVIPISKQVGAVLETIGIWAFFIVIAGFGVWVIGTFLSNISKLKGKEAHS